MQQHQLVPIKALSEGSGVRVVAVVLLAVSEMLSRQLGVKSGTKYQVQDQSGSQYPAGALVRLVVATHG